MGFARRSPHPVFRPPGKSPRPPIFSMSSPAAKKIPLRRYPKSLLYPPPSRSSRGALAIVTDVERDAVDADGAFDEWRARRTEKSRGPDAPTLASSFAKRFARRQWQESPVTGESAKETVKTTARGMPDVSGVTVVTNARVYYTTRAAADAPSVRHSLRPLNGGQGNLRTNLGRNAPRDREAVSSVIARSEATKQSISPRKERLDCFASLAMKLLD